MLNTNSNTLLKKKLFLCLVIIILTIKQIVNINYSYADTYLYLTVQIILILVNKTSIIRYLTLIIFELILIVLFKFSYINSNIFFPISFVLTIIGVINFLKPKNINQYLNQPIQLYLHHVSITTILLLITHSLLNIHIHALNHLNYLLEFVLILLQSYIIIYSILTLVNYLRKNLAQKLSIDFIKQNPYSETTNKILLFFEENKQDYLDPNFSINTLSEKTKIPIYDISRKINSELNTNYYTMIAFYRIQHAKELLIKEPNYKIEAISDECGFNSRGTFTKYFKQFVKCTPSEFRNQNE